MIKERVLRNFWRSSYGTEGAEGAGSRLRAVLMTSCAMIAGMVPMALSLGEAGEQNAPLGRAVVGGLAAATLATLFILPCLFAIVQRRAGTASASLDPDDPDSRYFDLPQLQTPVARVET